MFDRGFNIYSFSLITRNVFGALGRTYHHTRILSKPTFFNRAPVLVPRLLDSTEENIKSRNLGTGLR